MLQRGKGKPRTLISRCGELLPLLLWLLVFLVSPCSSHFLHAGQ